MVNLELGKICEDIAKITSDNGDPGGWLIDMVNLEKDPQRHCKDYLLQC